jgi:pyridoxamine 5'-phosphate oxidase
VARVPRAESEAYFATRPRGSQLAAWASHQSSVLIDRAELEASFAEAEARFAAGDVPCPPYWGGYRLVPDEIELWQGRPNRMHDRLRYERDPATPSGWRIVRLSP